MTKIKARITGNGVYLPERVLTNKDLEQMVETSDEWIVERTGMRERRIAAEGEYASDLGEKAARQALAQAGLEPKDVDLIFVATCTPDYLFPATAALILHKLGISGIPAFDIQAACSGYLYGLTLAKSLVESGMYRTVLFIAAEKLSAFTNYKDRTTCILFGDGAGASVIRAEGAGLAIEQAVVGADGELAELVILRGGGSRHPLSSEMLAKNMHYIEMNGREIFKHAVRRMESAVKECLDRCGLPESAIKWLVPHQANERIIDALAKRFEVPTEQVFKTVHKYGNTSASSVVIALTELLQEKPIAVGDHIMLTAFGGGLSWGSALLKKVAQ